MNSHSIGIEICNPGHQFGIEPYPDTQIETLITLSEHIIKRWDIPRTHILAHSDIAPERKKDPGELFPWKALAREGLGFWPNDIELYPTYSDDKLYDIAIHMGFDPNAKREALITAFKRHFMQNTFIEDCTETRVV